MRWHHFHCGGGGIRTPEGFYTLPVFKTGAINHSTTPPDNFKALVRAMEMKCKDKKSRRSNIPTFMLD